MSRDNWERLVVAVLRNEELREIARAPSMDPSDVSSRLSFTSISSDLNSRFSFSSPPHEHVPVWPPQVTSISTSISTQRTSSSTPHEHVPVSPPQAVNKSRAVPFTGSSFVDWIIPKRRLAKLKEKFFRRNGGLILPQKLSGDYLANETVRIFPIEELLRATNNYNEGNIICRVGDQTVYKGILPDGRAVAIKKPRIIDENRLKNYINEVIVVSQINHRNVVKMMGCCLETEVPLLVYEFIPNGTLFSHIHDPFLASGFPWEMRVKIAAETAWALAHLHSATSALIVHRDINSENILLDHTYTAKLISFGTSRLFTLDQSEVLISLEGTLGYLDPEYFITSHLTDKSDVYSFGVVLAELITGMKAYSVELEHRSLANYFVSCIREDRLIQILDRNLVRGDLIEQLKRVAELAEWCLRLKSKERPSMKEVAMELETLRSVKNRQWRDEDLNEEEVMEHLFNPTTPSSINGGFLLQPKNFGDYLANEKIKIFTVEDLQRATNNYDEGNVIGRGRYGTIYKGILPDYGVVAIKQSIKIYQQQIEKYIKEVEIASKINHQNVVKILGCCLGTEVPLLVYEFIINGTLSSHIHDPVLASNFSWQMRIKVAAETAAALAYLHMVPVIHGDIKSENILLGQVYTAKVSDFGAYRLDNSESTTFVQGTIGYLDPEYLQFGQVTGKSDVYSFGVVLAELLTGRQAVSFDRPEEERSLATYFLSAIQEDLLLQILDQNLLGQDKIEQLKRVAKLSVWCLSEKREERPSMKEVAMELEALRSVENHPWTDEYLNHENIMEHLFNRTTSSNLNSGFHLRHKLSRDYLDKETLGIFTAEELQRATNNYDEGNIIGRGGYGTVYKGNLPDYGVVAIKKSRIIYRGQIEKYINEVQIVSQINHQNVVKMLGCCLEMEVPLQVYEFITNGTLFSHIHDPILADKFSWEMRMKVAAETAAALAYLHMVPIIHGDMKSANILLDQSYIAKVSDFGASRFDTLDDSVLTTLVQGTIGYLDPEYLHFGQLVEKSDVYSFGVILAELLTTRKAFSRDRPEEDRILSSYFLNAIRDDRLVQIVDKNLITEDRIEQVKRFAKLTECCLKSKREERPSMKEVAMELEALRSVENHQRIDEYLNHKEIIQHLI